MTKYQCWINRAIGFSWRNLNLNPPFPVCRFQSSDAQSSHLKAHSCVPAAPGIWQPHLSHFQPPGLSTERQLGYLYIDFPLVYLLYLLLILTFLKNTRKADISKVWNFQSYWGRRKDREREDSLLFLCSGIIKLLLRLYTTYNLATVNTAALVLTSVYITVGRDTSRLSNMWKPSFVLTW